MSNEYIDLKGILALELPNLTRRLPTLRKMAQELGWPYRKRQGRGGGMEYQVAGLPEPIQPAVRERQAAQLLAQSQPAVLPSVAKAKRPVAVRRMADIQADCQRIARTNGSLAGAVSGAVSGGVVATGIAFIRAKFGF